MKVQDQVLKQWLAALQVWTIFRVLKDFENVPLSCEIVAKQIKTVKPLSFD